MPKLKSIDKIELYPVTGYIPKDKKEQVQKLARKRRKKRCRYSKRRS